MKKRGKGYDSSRNITKEKTPLQLHKLNPRHLKKLVRHTKKTKLKHRYKAKKKAIKKEKIKEVGIVKYLKDLHKLDFEPLSIKVLVIYLIFLGLFNVLNLVFGVKASTFVLFGITLTGAAAFILHILVIVLLLLVAYGIGRRERWGFNLALLWFSVGILNSILTAVFMRSVALGFVRQLTLISSISVVAINSLVIWYLIAQKKYFFEHIRKKKTLEIEDRVFVYTIISFWIVVLLIGITLGVRFFKATTAKTDELVYELNGKTLWEAIDICYAKQGSEKDLCHIVIATMHRGSDAIDGMDICSKVESDFFRYTCKRAQT